MNRSAKDTKHRVRRFFRAHNRSLTFIGAMIVFATFVVKEGFRDHLKDLVDQTDNATSVFAIRQDTERTGLVLKTIEDEIANGNAARSSERTSRATNDADTIHRDLVRFREEEPMLASSLDNVDALMDKSGNVGYGVDLFDLIKLKAEIEIASLNLNATPAQLNDLILQFETLQIRVSAIETQALVSANLAKYKNERLYSICAWVSYGLYAFGWGLGLCGRLSGGEVLGSA
jgi:hypothetical protein